MYECMYVETSMTCTCMSQCDSVSDKRLLKNISNDRFMPCNLLFLHQNKHVLYKYIKKYTYYYTTYLFIYCNINRWRTKQKTRKFVKHLQKPAEISRPTPHKIYL